MAKEDILKQIYMQALQNRHENLTDKPVQSSVPHQHRPAVAKVVPSAVQQVTQVPQRLVQRAIDIPDDRPDNFNEREQLLHDLMGVYRQKRKMIDDLPPKHRVLLEKLSRLMLGVQDTKQPPGGH